MSKVKANNGNVLFRRKPVYSHTCIHEPVSVSVPSGRVPILAGMSRHIFRFHLMCDYDIDNPKPFISGGNKLAENFVITCMYEYNVFSEFTRFSYNKFRSKRYLHYIVILTMYFSE